MVHGQRDEGLGVVTLRDLAEVPVSERYTTSVRTVARSLDELPAVSVRQPATVLLAGREVDPAVFLAKLAASGEAVESARLLSRLRGAQQPAP